MSTLYFIGGTLGLGALALFLAVWQLIRKAKKAEGLERDKETQKAFIGSISDAKEARERLDADPAYAKRVRDKYTRD